MVLESNGGSPKEFVNWNFNNLKMEPMIQGKNLIKGMQKRSWSNDQQETNKQIVTKIMTILYDRHLYDKSTNREYRELGHYQPY